MIKEAVISIPCLEGAHSKNAEKYPADQVKGSAKKYIHYQD